MNNTTDPPSPANWRPATPAERVWLMLAAAGWPGELCRIERGEIVRYKVECVENQQENTEE